MNPRLKYILKRILPPVAVDAAKSVRRILQNHAAPSLPELEAIADSDALWTGSDGWHHQSIADAQRKKWPVFLASVEGEGPFGWAHEAPIATLATSGPPPVDLGAHNTIISFGYVLGRAATGRTRISVLDWGGGSGHYYVYARRLHPELDLEYVVKDLEALCDLGRDLLPDVTFLSDDAAALTRRCDLVFCSSSLHYTRDFYDLLGRLCDAAERWLVVTRLPFIDQHEDFVFVQRAHRAGYMTEYPAWVVNRHKFVAFVSAKGFKLDREFMLGDSLVIENAPEQCVFRGYLFKRIDASPVPRAV